MRIYTETEASIVFQQCQIELDDIRSMLEKNMALEGRSRYVNRVTLRQRRHALTLQPTVPGFRPVTDEAEDNRDSKTPLSLDH